MSSLNAYDCSAGLFVRGLTNLKTQLTRAEDHAAAGGIGEAAMLEARLATEASATDSPADVHSFTLAAQVHWAAEGARLAIAHLLGAPAAPAPNEARTLADLHRKLDATIAQIREVAQGDLEAGLDREVTIKHRGGSTHSDGGQFLLAYAIPHFTYHLATAYGILRNQGVRLTMGDFLGNWGTG